MEQFKAYCDICKDGSRWFSTLGTATEWRADHFDETHSNNPMQKQNCRIKRRVIEQE